MDRQSYKGRKRRRGALRALLCLSLCVCLLPVLARSAQATDLAVIYPDVPEPYSRVFEDIIDGIDQAYEGELLKKVLPMEITSGDVQQWLEQKSITKVIALGNQAMGVVLELPESYVTVTGAVLSVDPVKNLGTGFSAVTLAPDPYHTFQQLQQLAPKVTTVSVIYNEGYHGRLISRARDAASDLGLVLELHQAAGLSADSVMYKQFFQVEDAEKRAVWLLQGDRALEDRSVLYNLLKDAWYNKLLVFSDNPSYVKKGVLFSLYPDHDGMGKSLVEALEKQKNGQNIGVVQTRSLHSALNIRTAEHLGLSLSRSQRRGFDVIFPRR